MVFFSGLTLLFIELPRELLMLETPLDQESSFVLFGGLKLFNDQYRLEQSLPISG